MTRIIFICTGNTCRSPMAAALFNLRYAGSGMSAGSAGIYAAEGEPMSPNARLALLELGIEDSPMHRSRRLTPDMLGRDAVAVCMGEGHRQAVLSLCPTARALRLAEWDISDPYGGGIDVYRSTLAEIDSALNTLINRIGRN